MVPPDPSSLFPETPSVTIRPRLLALAVTLPLVVAGCAKDNDVTAIGGSFGKSTKRNTCPAVAIPAETGDVTLFDPPASRDARAIDIVATVADLRGQCTDDGASDLRTTATFRVDARRSSASGARDVTLPYFAVVVRGGDQVVSKSQSQVLVHFDDGKLTASTTARADSTISRAETGLPEAVRDKLNRKRKAKDEDASIDPMTDPQVRAALSRASFELLVGFQLTNEQLAYNATR